MNLDNTHCDWIQKVTQSNNSYGYKKVQYKGNGSKILPSVPLHLEVFFQRYGAIQGIRFVRRGSFCPLDSLSQYRF